MSSKPRFPILSAPADWPAVHALPLEAWGGALAWAEVALGLPTGPWERLAGGEDSAVFARGASVLKLVPPIHAADAEREAAVLPRLRLPVPSPRLLGVARIEGWTALHLGRLPGTNAEPRWRALARADQLAVLRDLGGVLAALHATPLAPSDGNPAATMARLRARARRHEAEGFPEVEAFLDRHLPPEPPVVLVHFDLHPGNLMLGADDRLAGVLDLVASRAFHPAMDLVTPGVFCARGDPERLGALLDAAGLPDLGPEELVAWHLLHPFSELRRDLAMAGRAADDLPRALLELWRR